MKAGTDNSTQHVPSSGAAPWRAQLNGARAAFSVFVALVCFLAVVAAAAAASGPKEYVVKAACLFNFSKFIDWPTNAFSTPDSPFVIGIAGANPFGSDLQTMVQGHSVAGHPITVREIAPDDPAAGDCQILFISRATDSAAASLLQSLDKKPVLTVGETESFARCGGMIQFAVESSRLRFDINAESASRSGLNIRAQLLKLAREVRGREATR